ncbi:MAG: hypothetical protein HYU43_08000 [Armatimonadetes bacterium]|nr:hypothetical protein [Armatimonadota bacterium]
MQPFPQSRDPDGIRHGGGTGGVEPMTPAETPHLNKGPVSGMVLAGGRASRMGHQ